MENLIRSKAALYSFPFCVSVLRDIVPILADIHFIRVGEENLHMLYFFRYPIPLNKTHAKFFFEEIKIKQFI